MKGMELHLLGTFQLVLAGDLVTDFRSDKARALLAYLALEGHRSQRRETLASLLWGESPARNARASLRVALSQLRRQLSPLLETTDEAAVPLLDANRQSVQFNADYPGCWIDVVEFDAQLAAQQTHRHHGVRLCAACVQRLARAVELYRGPFLAGLSLPDSPTFDEWLTTQQAVRDQQFSAALQQLLAHYTDLADYPQVIAYARRQLELEPWHEEAQRSLMWALALNGQRAAALTQYTACREILQQEFDAEPSSSTVNLYRQIRDGALGWEAEAAGTQDWTPPQPYKGLQAFEETDAGYFFGREALVDRLVARLSEPLESAETASDVLPAWMRRFLAVVGPSGSGKSSLVRAGVIPALRRSGEPWFIATMVPGEDPQRELLGALDAALPADQAPHFDAADTAATLAAAITERLPPDARLLLFIDQGEELFTLTQDEASRTAFTAGLLDALHSWPQRLWLVATLRADYYDRPLRDPRWSRLFHQRLEIAPPLTPEELERAITGPASRVGLTVEQGLVTTLVAAVGQQPGSLPLLQYTLTELFERREGRRMTLAAYDAMGGLAGALVGRTEALYAGLNATEQAAARQLFLRLVVPGERTGYARRRVPLGELASLSDNPIALQAVMKRFDQRRLLTFDLDVNSREPTVEIAHDVLLEAWPRLRYWLEVYEEEIRLYQRLASAAEEWRATDQNPGYLAHGLRLERFETLLRSDDLALTPLESAYLEASLAARERQRAEERERRAREAAIEEQSRAHQRIAQREAAISQSLNLTIRAQLALNEGNTDLALALATAANQLPDPLRQAQLVLARAAYAPGTRHVFQGHNGAVADLALTSGAGKKALSASADGTLILWDLVTGVVLRRLCGHKAAVNGVAFLPSGEQALSACSDGTLILWDISAEPVLPLPSEAGGSEAKSLNADLEAGDANRQVLRRFEGHIGAVRDVDIHPDCDVSTGCLAISAGDDGTCMLWDVARGERVQRLNGHEGAVNAVAFSPDGRTALSGSADHSLILWDVATGDIVHHLQGRTKMGAQVAETEIPEVLGHEGPVSAVVFAPNGRTAYSVANDRRLITWDLKTGTPLRASIFDLGIYSLEVSTDGRYVLLGMVDGRVILWVPYYGQTAIELLGHSGRVQTVAFCPDGRQALSGSADGTVRLWDLRSGAEVRSFIYDGSALDVTLSPDGQQLLLAGGDSDLSLWDYETGAEIRRLVGHTEMPFAGVRFGPPAEDGQAHIAVSGAGDIFGKAEDTTLRVWDLETGQEIQRFEGHTDCLWDMDLSLDCGNSAGCLAVSGSADGTVRVWDLEQGAGTVLINVLPQTVRSVALSPDGRNVLVGLLKGTSDAPDYGLRLVDRQSGAVQKILPGHTDTVAAITFSPNGRMALSAGHDKQVILWEIETGREIRRFVGHVGSVNQVKFSPDGHLALSAGMDNLIILWDVETGVALRYYTGHVGGVLGIAFTPEGRSFVSVAADDSVREWRIDATQEALQAWIAQNRHISELSYQQRVQYHVEPLDEASEAVR